MPNLGRYQLHELLGQGAMGKVHRAYDPVLERDVAIKTMATGLDVDPEIRERFYREAKACARLQHPSIITVFDLGEIDRMAFIVMELLKGSDLKKIIVARTPIPLEKKVKIMMDVCSALSHAHKRGIIHRDIKPSNLFFSEGGEVKVLDFGIARLPSSRLTVANPILGTPNYLAPEVIRGISPADARSDLFSAAVVFFQLLCYRHPFESDDIPKRIMHGLPSSLLEFDLSFPIALDRIFSKALASDPHQRYRSGDELAEDLAALTESRRAAPMFDGRPPRATPPSEDFANTKLFPANPDEFEFHTSQVLRLVPDFETRIASGDNEGARKILIEITGIQSSDGRFAETVDYCRSLLNDVPTETQSPSGVTAQTAGSSARPAKPCPFCGQWNRLAARHCIQCGVALVPPALVPAEVVAQERPGAPMPSQFRPTPLSTEPMIQPDASAAKAQHSPAAPAGRIGWWQSLQTTLDSYPIWAVAALTAIITTSLFLLGWSIFHY